MIEKVELFKNMVKLEEDILVCNYKYEWRIWSRVLEYW